MAEKKYPVEIIRPSDADIKAYYMQPGVISKMFEVSKGKEVVPVFGAKKYGKRPSSVPNKGDIDYLIRNGTTSLHGSVELWKNPLALSNDLSKQEMAKLRSGWDMIFDIDCNASFEYARVTALILIDALEMFGIKNWSAKFSGSRGMHVAISHNSFPSTINYMPIAEMYPDLPRQIVGFLRYFMKKKLIQRFLQIDEKEASGLMKDEESGEMDPYNIVDVEENWGVRHLFRLPYSFNEKTWLVSRPLTKEQIRTFTFEDARHDKVKGEVGFLDSWEKDEASILVLETIDWAEAKQEEEERLRKERGEYQGDGRFEGIKTKIDPQFFPPCIARILEGIEDGRKRAIFIMINFLMTCGWSPKEIEEELHEWNKRNPDPISSTYIMTQLNYAVQRGNPIMPPNCKTKGYYDDLKVCSPDGFCQKIANPASYAIKRYALHVKMNKSNKSKKSDDGKNRKKDSAGSSS